MDKDTCFINRIKGVLKQVLTGAMMVALMVPCFGCGKKPSGINLAPGDDKLLVIYTSHKEDVYLPIIEEFEERTGIYVDIVTGGTTELLESIEKDAANPVADVMFGGGVESLESYRECLEPYRTGEYSNLLPQYRSEDDIWTPFSALPVVLVYNTKLVEAGSLSSWRDLLKSTFSGRIAYSSPEVSGSSYTALKTLSIAMGRFSDANVMNFAKALSGRVLSSSNDVLSNVADGTDLVGITVEETALKRIADGADLTIVYPSDGTSIVPDGTAIVKDAKHIANARMFVDFVSGEDVQRLLGERMYRRSVRSDMSQDLELIDISDIKVIEYDVRKASDSRESLVMSWKFYFGGEND